MAIQIQGNGNVVVECDAPTFSGMRVTMRPVDYGSLGQYRCVMFSLHQMNAGLAAGSEIYQVRWTATPQLALIWGVIFDGFWVTTAFTAGFCNMTLSIARGWTVDGTGGVTADLTGNNQKLRTSMATSLMGTIRCSDTAALTAGTKTLDAQPVGQIAFVVNNSNSISPLKSTPLYGPPSLEAGGNNAPIVLVQNEGLAIKATVPATGVWGFGVDIGWSEVAAY